MEPQTTFRFGEVEAVLADVNEIPSVMRTKFQARLKNFHRLGFPDGFGKGQPGRAVVYGLRELLLMAVAVELTQLGLTPERTIDVITSDEFPVWMSVSLACTALQTRPEVFNAGPGDTGNPPDQKLWGFSSRWADAESTDPASMFLYCDPAVLSPWEEADEEWESEGIDIASATFFYGGAGVIRDNITRWTTGPSRRIALINVTKLLFDIAAYLAGENGLALVRQFDRVATDWMWRGDFNLDEWLMLVAKRFMARIAAGPGFLPGLDDEGERDWIAHPATLLEDLPEDHAFRRITKPIEQAEIDGLRDRSIADMVIRLPGQRELQVDAKMLPMADIPQDAILDRVEELANRPKTMFSDKTDFIVLYIPSDHFYQQAVAADRNIFQKALDQKVVIATPPVLLNLLAEAATAWDKYRKEFPDLGEEEWNGLQDEPWPDPDDAAAMAASAERWRKEKSDGHDQEA